MSYARGTTRKNVDYANKGKALEDLVEYANKQYKAKGMALVQKISTPWVVKRQGTRITSAFPSGKSTLDFRGTVQGGTSISFDCKESADERGLPLAHIQDHQIEYMRTALKVGEVTFLLVHIKPLDKYLMASGEQAIQYWDRWKLNKGKRGFNFIPVESMREIKMGQGIALDYLAEMQVCYMRTREG